MTDVGTPGTEPASRSGREPATLVSAVLDEESRRQPEAAAVDEGGEATRATFDSIGSSPA
jgi:hypothetical protein